MQTIGLTNHRFRNTRNNARVEKMPLKRESDTMKRGNCLRVRVRSTNASVSGFA